MGGGGLIILKPQKKKTKNRKELRKWRKIKSWDVKEENEKKCTRRKRKGLKKWTQKKMFAPLTSNNGNGDSRASAHGVGGDNGEMQTKRPR